MAQYLEDGAVIPSYLSSSTRGGAPGSTAMLNDNVLRLGEVKQIIFPDDKRSYGKKTVEYEVEVQYREANGIYATAMYRGVTVSTQLGGIADRFHATFRADTGGNEEAQVGTGSKVLLLCLAGDQQKAIIIGGVEDPENEKAEKKDDGHNLFFEFNGIRFTINKDGEMTVLFRGATKEDGELAKDVKKENGGATLNINKDGNFSIKTVDKDGKDENVVTWDHKAGDLTVLTTGNWKATVEKETSTESKNGFVWKSSDKGAQMEVKDKVIIKSAGVKVGKADEAWVLGTTWRSDLKTMNSDLKSALNNAAQELLTASIQMKIAAGLNAIPYTGGSASQTNFQQVSTGLQSAGQALQKAGSAIESYESKASGHLSSVNFGDKG